MNKREERTLKERLQTAFSARWKDILLVAALALVLLFAVWKILPSGSSEEVYLQRTDAETKVCRLLQQIEGVGDAEVIVCEKENGETSVVVVCDGGKNLQVIMDVREAVASALGTNENAVKVYQKK